MVPLHVYFNPIIRSCHVSVLLTVYAIDRILTRTFILTDSFYFGKQVHQRSEFVLSWIVVIMGNMPPAICL